MIPIVATYRVRHDRQRGVPSHDVDGFAPAVDAALAIAPSLYYDFAGEAWHERESPHRRLWVVLHRPTGFQLGPDWYTQEDAWRLLLACDPGFSAWQYATGSAEDPATVACRHHFLRALESIGVRSLRNSESRNKRGRSRGK